MFHIAICDSNPQILTQLTDNILKLPNPSDVLSIHTFLGEQALLRDCRQGCCYNLVLLGPFQQDHRNLALARKIRSFDPQMPISLISNSFQDSLAGYEVPLYRCYPHPFPPRILHRDLQELIRKRRNSCYTFVFSNWQGLHRFPLKDVIYFKALGSRIQVVTALGNYEYRETLGGLEKQLGRFNFMRIHRSYVLNLHWVRNVWGREVTLLNGSVLPLSKHRSRELRESLKRQNIE